MRTRLVRSALRPTAIVCLLGLFVPIMAAHAWGQEATKGARAADLARYFPRKDLVAYGEFEGLDAHRIAWEKTAAYRLLNETTTGAMLEQSAARLMDLALGSQGATVGGRDLVALGEHLLRSGFAVGINRAGGAGPTRCVALVIRGASTGKVRAIIDRLLRVAEHPRPRPGRSRSRVVGRSTSWAIRRGAASHGGPRGMTWSSA